MKDQRTISKELGIPLSQLRHVASEPRSFYFYKTRQIGKKKRLLRIPKGPLRPIQNAIRTRILAGIPLPSSVHGWRKGRSTKTYAREHARKAVVLNADIQDFFPSVNAGRVHAFWRNAGYSAEAAAMLTTLTTLDNQLPQGAPTSSPLGNQIMKPLHGRLSALAQQHKLSYGSYGDEVTLSGRRRVARLKGLTVKIISQEGFTANPNKVKVMPREKRQELAGNVVNKKCGPGRESYRELRAILHNCLRHGPESQNTEKHPRFREHLLGRIAQFRYLNPRLGYQLQAQFEKIAWPACNPAAESVKRA
jgi:RNA-directed DNA polymerase